MKLSSKNILSRIKTYSLKGSSCILNLLVNSFNLQVLLRFYQEGFIQSVKVVAQKEGCSLFLVNIFLRIVGGYSLLSNLKLFNSSKSSVYLKTIDRVNCKQVTFIVSTATGITTLFNLKKIRKSGVLLLSC